MKPRNRHGVEFDPKKVDLRADCRDGLGHDWRPAHRWGLDGLHCAECDGFVSARALAGLS